MLDFSFFYAIILLKEGNLLEVLGCFSPVAFPSDGLLFLPSGGGFSAQGRRKQNRALILCEDGHPVRSVQGIKGESCLGEVLLHVFFHERYAEYVI